jgi:ferredoxin
MEDRIHPEIIEDLCTGCGICVDACPNDALHMVEGIPRFDPAVECEYCGECEAACPTEAVRREFLIVFGQPNVG